MVQEPGRTCLSLRRQSLLYLVIINYYDNKSLHIAAELSEEKPVIAKTPGTCAVLSQVLQQIPLCAYEGRTGGGDKNRQ